MPRALTNLINQTFGQLTVISKADDKVRPNGKKDVYWNVRCTCGNTSQLRTSHLTVQNVKSCLPCSSKGRQGGLKHGGCGTPVYAAWEHMRQRCLNQNFKQFKDYGGRGVTICKEWDDFSVFLKDMGEPAKGLTLDRKDNNLGYCPGNCRWATKAEQTQNRRNVILNWDKVREIRASSLPAKEIALLYGIVQGAVYCIRTNKIWKV